MYALADCNNFFVSCERSFQPELEGLPVVVLSNNDGIIIARSNESKKMGIKMGSPFFEIKKLVESGKVIAKSSNLALYGDISSRVMAILSEVFPKVDIYSIDEAFISIEGMSIETAKAKCRETIIKIRRCTGIPISIGIAPTKTLAKTANHFAKRHQGYQGVCVIDSEEKIHKALSLTSIDDVWGIGRRLTPKLINLGVKTALDFTNRPEAWVYSLMGIGGLRTWRELKGIDSIVEREHERRQSICTSRSFATMISDFDQIALQVSDFAAKCAEKLRSEHSAAYCVTVFILTNRFREELGQYYSKTTIYLDAAASSTHEIVGAALKALKIIFRQGYLYKKAGVIVHDICNDGSVQGSLFEENEGNYLDYNQERRDKYDRVAAVIDSINIDGNSLVRLGTQRSAHTSSPGFSKISILINNSHC